MSDDLKYLILPDEPKYKTGFVTEVSLTEREKKNVEAFISDRVTLFLVLAVLALLVISTTTGYLLAGLLASQGNADFVITGFLIGALASTIVVLRARYLGKKKNILNLGRQKVEEINQGIRTANQMEDKRVANEAMTLTATLSQIHESSTKLANELHHHLDHVSQLLQDAESEYHANAFAPFWDAIEDAAKHLAAFNDKAKSLSGNADEYYGKLMGKKHTFPSFPVQIRTIPDASSATKEFRRVVRMGQTNHDFADIWELRRIQKVMLAGFRTLGEAVNNLGATIEYSVSNLQRSISSHIAEVVEEEIRTRKTFDKRMLEQNRMLDNIQQHRKPKTTDSPSRY